MLSFDHQNHSKWHKWCHVRYKVDGRMQPHHPSGLHECVPLWSGRRPQLWCSWTTAGHHARPACSCSGGAQEFRRSRLVRNAAPDAWSRSRRGWSPSPQSALVFKPARQTRKGSSCDDALIGAAQYRPRVLAPRLAGAAQHSVGLLASIPSAVDTSDSEPCPFASNQPPSG